MVSRGLSSQNERCKIIENRLYDQVLTQKTQSLIDKLDSELVSYAYKDDKKPKREKINNSIKFNSKSKLKHKKSKKIKSHQKHIIKNVCKVWSITRKADDRKEQSREKQENRHNHISHRRAEVRVKFSFNDSSH